MCRTHHTQNHEPRLFVEKILYQGKFNVFLAKSTITNKQYAIKAFEKDEHSHYAFLQEKRIHSSLNHQNILKYVPDYLFQVDLSQYTVIFTEYASFGDFFNLILDYEFTDEKLIRTYFHQLIKGLQYLHSNCVAHLDLKLENLFLGDDYQLKIADFDMAQNISDKNLVSGGTANYRAPEVWTRSCKNFFSADIYSIGVCLYTLMTGAFPFLEENDKDSLQLFRYDTFLERNEEFWSENESIFSGQKSFSTNFKELINKMLAKDPSDRWTLEQITESRWYNEPIYSEEELQNEIRKVLTL